MDVNYDKDTFNCKFRTRVQLVGSTKKAFVHLFLDATHVKSLEICDNDEAVPPVTENALMGRGLSMSSDSVTTLRFALKSVASLVVPDLALHKNSSCEELETLLRIGKCKTFSVHVSSSAINKERLSSLCSALAENSLQPAAEGVLSNLYVNSSYKKVDQVDQIWSSKPVGSSIPHETSTASEASNNEAAGPSGLTPSSSSGGHGKRRSVSPDSLQNPSKRQALTEDAAENPLKIIYAFQEAQKAELASLKKDLVALRGQVQQLQRAPGVDAGTQTDPIVEHRSELFPETDPSHVIHTPARTVENTMDNRFTMFEQNIDAKIRVKFGKICRRLDDRLLDNEMDITDEGILRERLDQRLVQRLESNEEQVCVHQKVSPLLSFRHEITVILSFALHSVCHNAIRISGAPSVSFVISSVTMYSPFSRVKTPRESRGFWLSIDLAATCNELCKSTVSPLPTCARAVGASYADPFYPFLAPRSRNVPVPRV